MISLDPAVEAQLNHGEILSVSLVRFDLPGKVAAYHDGGRPYTYNGVIYLPNRWLDMGSAKGALGIGVTRRTISFRAVPSENPDDAIAKLELFDYMNAPVIISVLTGHPATRQPLGVLTSTLYEIADVRYPISPMGRDGEQSVTVEIDLEMPGRSARGSTLVKVSPGDHNFDNDAEDTFLEYAATNAKVQEEWGQRSG